jgi:hypothetical protein
MVLSGTMSFGHAGGYDLKQTLYASFVRTIIAVPLGPLTRYYTDSLRQMRNEPIICKETNFKDQPWKYSLPRAAAMIGIPLVLAGTILLATPN